MFSSSPEGVAFGDEMSQVIGLARSGLKMQELTSHNNSLRDTSLADGITNLVSQFSDASKVAFNQSQTASTEKSSSRLKGESNAWKKAADLLQRLRFSSNTAPASVKADQPIKPR